MFARGRGAASPAKSRRGALSAPRVDAAALRRWAGEETRLVLPRGPEQRNPLFAGHFAAVQVREGFELHSSDILQLQDTHSRFTFGEERVKVILKLEGLARVRIGGLELPLEAGVGSEARPCGVVLTLGNGDEFERSGQTGERERMVVLTLTRDWLAACGIDHCLPTAHPAVWTWAPSARSIAIAEQLIRPEQFEGPMQNLFRESRALELIAEALGQTSPIVPEPAGGLPAAAYRRICRLQRLLDSGEADSMDMRTIAGVMGCNANTLQLHFRRAFGRSIFDYLRNRRLAQAARALQQDGVSVARAAEIAGYASQANFSTAFRRHFGVTPKRYQSRL